MLQVFIDGLVTGAIIGGCVAGLLFILFIAWALLQAILNSEDWLIK